MQTNTHSLVASRLLTRSLLASIALSFVLLMSGCATSAPSFGDSVASESDQYDAISGKWEEGQSLVSKGEKKIKKGRKQVSDGNENLSDGEAMVRRGKRLMAESEEEYKLKKAY